MTVDGRTYDDRAEAGQALRDRWPAPSTGSARRHPRDRRPRGLTFDAKICAVLARGYDLVVAALPPQRPVAGSLTQLLEAKPNALPVRLENRLTALDRSTYRDEIARAQRQLDQPFAHGEALEQARRRVADLDNQLSDLAASSDDIPEQAADGEQTPGSDAEGEGSCPSRRPPTLTCSRVTLRARRQQPFNARTAPGASRQEVAGVLDRCAAAGGGRNTQLPRAVIHTLPRIRARSTLTGPCIRTGLGIARLEKGIGRIPCRALVYGVLDTKHWRFPVEFLRP